MRFAVIDHINEIINKLLGARKGWGGAHAKALLV